MKKLDKIRKKVCIWGLTSLIRVIGTKRYDLYKAMPDIYKQVEAEKEAKIRENFNNFRLWKELSDKTRWYYYNDKKYIKNNC